MDVCAETEGIAKVIIARKQTPRGAQWRAIEVVQFWNKGITILIINKTNASGGKPLATFVSEFSTQGVGLVPNFPYYRGCEGKFTPPAFFDRCITPVNDVLIGHVATDQALE